MSGNRDHKQGHPVRNRRSQKRDAPLGKMTAPKTGMTSAA